MDRLQSPCPTYLSLIGSRIAVKLVQRSSEMFPISEKSDLHVLRLFKKNYRSAKSKDVESESVGIGCLAGIGISQSRYSTLDRELLAIYEAVKRFRHLVETMPTIAFTDHQPLVSLFRTSSENLSPQQTRHLSFISEFVDDVRYIRGDANIVADTLLRNVAPVTLEAVMSASFT